MRSRSASSAHPDRPPVSVVVVTHNEGERLSATVHALLATMPRDGDLLVVDDQSTDGSCDSLHDLFPDVRVIRTVTQLGPAGARNLGAANVPGRVIVFSDAHVQPEPGWVAEMLPAANRRGAGLVAPAVSSLADANACGYGMTWRDAALNVDWLPYRGPDPYPVPFLAGMFVAVRRDVFRRCGGFDPGMAGWGSEDIELSLRAWALGRTCVVAPRAHVGHLFRPRFPYAVDPAAVLHNLIRTALIHLGPARLERVFAALCRSPTFPAALARVVAGDAVLRRDRLSAGRRHDDQWLLNTFDITALRTDLEETPA